MNSDLRTKYPEIFSGECEISTGPGWYNILDALCLTIQSHINNRKNQHQAALDWNSMAEALRNGDDQLFLKYFKSFEPDSEFVQRRRKEIMDGASRPVVEPCLQVVAIQIKEKFGGLRFYYGGGDQCISGMVRMAEAMSEVTCEDCGAPGTLGGRGWIRTLCDTHRNQKT